MKKKFFTLSLSLIALSWCSAALHEDNKAVLTDVLISSKPLHLEVGRVRVDSIGIDNKKKTVTVVCNENTAYLPHTSQSVEELKTKIKETLGEKYSKYKLKVIANGYPIEQLALGAERKNLRPTEKKPFVKHIPGDFERPITQGLENTNIAVWQSHGWYFEKKLNRWEWQRARIMQTVEDLYTQSYVVPYLMPMLENAGAYVLCPRERDMNVYEVIIDNDGMLAEGVYTENDPSKWSEIPEGFGHKFVTYNDQEDQKNPFRLGTARIARSESKATAEWNAEIPQTREYAVYVSYKTLPNSSEEAIYTVNAADGEHKVKVNQKMGGGTWIFIGKYPLLKGKSDKPIVTIEANGKKGTVVSADAVKIGGGMGNIARKAVLTGQDGAEVTEYIASGYPRFTEGARYWLQWAGMPDSVYTPFNGQNDYNDDYTSRAHWVNYMAGGSSMVPKQKGLNIPVDLSFAFHSDAGTTYNDSIIGTLGIYSTNNGNTTGNGSSRLSNRDLTDLVITQIVNDIRATHEPNWTRRGLWDKAYFEARKPEVPAMLLELLSHQNFADMKYGLDPAFRFTVSRAIYKAMGRYIASRDNREFTVQPLPVASFAIVSPKSGTYTLTWKPTEDKLEESATPTYYIIQKRTENGSFIDIASVETPSYTFTTDDNKIHSFRIVAGNDGGTSFPSEILALCYNGDSNPVNIVNGFTRVSGPDTFDAGDIAGFYDMRDHGVPYMEDISFIGSQFEFRRSIPWMDDDAAGFGASRANFEDKVIAGNTFDYVYRHGEAIRNAGKGFISSSVQAYMESENSTSPGIVDLILGKQKEISVGTGMYGTKYKTFPEALQNKIASHCNAGGDIFVSGSYVATDLWDNCHSDSTILARDQKFATEVLGYHWRVGQASVEGTAYEVVSPFKSFGNGMFNFFNTLNADSYVVESPDSFYASDKRGATIMRYGENNLVAGIAVNDPKYQTVILGFPFESIIGEKDRDHLMKQILDFFNK